MTNLATLTSRNQERWDIAKLTRGPDFLAVAKRLCFEPAKQRYQAIERATGVPWFVVAVIHEREAGGDFSCQLGQGDPLNRVSVHVPKGRGPFLAKPNDFPGGDAFHRGALDALTSCPPFASRNKNWSAGGALCMLEQYNGLGYAVRGLPSPYVWSGTDQYHAGKYVRDGVFDPDVVDVQLGCAGLIRTMMSIDPTITFVQGVKINLPPIKPIPPQPVQIPAPPPSPWAAFFMAIANFFKPKV